MTWLDALVPYFLLAVVYTGIAFVVALLLLGVAFFLSIAFGDPWMP